MGVGGGGTEQLEYSLSRAKLINRDGAWSLRGLMGDRYVPGFERSSDPRFLRSQESVSGDATEVLLMRLWAEVHLSSVCIHIQNDQICTRSCHPCQSSVDYGNIKIAQHGHTHTHMYTHTYACTTTQPHMYARTHTHTHTHAPTPPHTHTHTHTHTPTHQSLIHI